MTKFLTGAAVAIAISATATAWAQPAPTPPPGVAQGTALPTPPPPPGAAGAPHVRMMVMSDRVITRDEVSQHVGKLFARVDANRDGFVTREEADAVHSKMMARMDGMARRMHAMSAMPHMPGADRGAMFDRLDTNHDGAISRQEYLSARPQIREERRVVIRDGQAGAAPGGPRDHMMMRMHGGMGRGMGMGAFGGRMFEMADGNRDGRVSLAEAQTAALAHFDRADVNRDGKVAPEERRQIRQTIRLERRAG